MPEFDGFFHRRPIIAIHMAATITIAFPIAK
jgi:hypothetical protein